MAMGRGAGDPAGEGSRVMLIPIGHEETEVRRWPWVSFSIIGLCLLALILTELSPAASPQRIGEKFARVYRYYMQHPYLELRPELKERLYAGVRKDEADALHEVVRQFGGKPPADPDRRAAEQAELDRLTAEAFAAKEAHPFFRWGLVPAHIRPHALVTHMFMHVGWWHLIGNMFIFYLCGPFLEDVWGRPLFAAFYLTAGVAAALAFVAHHPDMTGPLIGASGAVAGCMGAFLVRYWRTRIRFFYWFGIVFRGTFSAPAWIMLPLWLGREFLFANAADVAGVQGGVAHWAHVWGFVFGMVVAGAMVHFKVEQRYLNPAIEEKVTLAANPEVDRAHELFRAGRHDEALAVLAGVLEREPRNVDAALAYWHLAVQAGRPVEAAGAMLAAVREEIRSGQMDLAADHWLELAAQAPVEAVNLTVGARIVEHLVEVRRLEEAQQGLKLLAGSVDSTSPPGLIVRLARAAAVVGGAGAPTVLRAASGHPEIPEDQRAEFRRALQDLGTAGSVSPASEQEPPSGEDGISGEAAEVEAEPEKVELAEVWQSERTLRVVEAVPVGLGATEIRLRIGDKGERSLPLEQVQAVAVAGIKPPGGGSHLVLDLLLDSLWGSGETVRVVRLDSRTFDPRRILGVEGSPMEAFRGLVDVILKGSDGVPLPGPEAVMGRPFATFESIEAYEGEVLGATRSPR